MSDQRQIFYVDRRLPTTVLEETILDAVTFLKGAVLGAGGTAVGQIRLTAVGVAGEAGASFTIEMLRAGDALQTRVIDVSDQAVLEVINSTGTTAITAAISGIAALALGLTSLPFLAVVGIGAAVGGTYSVLASEFGLNDFTLDLINALTGDLRRDTYFEIEGSRYGVVTVANESTVAQDAGQLVTAFGITVTVY